MVDSPFNNAVVATGQLCTKNF